MEDPDNSSGADENSFFNYFTSFGIHILLIVIVIVLKWQYGKILHLKQRNKTFLYILIFLYRSQSIPLSKGTT